MMVKIIKCILCAFALICGYLLNYIGYNACLSYDVEFNYGRHRKRNIRKKNKGFWKKFLFLDIRHMVVKWHYLLFWINLLFYMLMSIFTFLNIILGSKSIEKIYMLFLIIVLLTDVIIGIPYIDIYFDDNHRRKKKGVHRYYRKNNGHRNDC